jgi:hypothetical protein
MTIIHARGLFLSESFGEEEGLKKGADSSAYADLHASND